MRFDLALGISKTARTPGKWPNCRSKHITASY